MHSTKRSSPLITCEEVVRYLPEGRGSVATVRHWIATKQLPSVKVGRHRLIRRRDLAAFLGVEIADLETQAA